MSNKGDENLPRGTGGAKNPGITGNALKGDSLASNGPRPTALKVNPLVKPSRPAASAPFLRSARPASKPISKPNELPASSASPSKSLFGPNSTRSPSPTKSKPLDLTPRGTYASPQRRPAASGSAAKPASTSGLYDPKSSDWNRPWNLADLRKELEQTDMSELATHSKPKYKLPPRQGISPTRSNVQSMQSMSAESRVEKVLDTLGDLTDKDIVIPETLKVPGLEPELLKHQIEGVTFMTSREASKDSVSGGFLCDDMGLGKTVQSIALILNAPPKPDAKRKTTLVVAPLAVMDQWVQEIRSKAPKLKVVSHQGSNRATSFKELAKNDVVVTTYNVVTSEMKTEGPLFQGKWFRVIADEAHEFRNQKTALANAMWSLQSKGRRWILTGTPIHNSVNDLFSLFKFVGVEPYNDFGNWKADIGDPIKRNVGSQEAVKLLSGLLHSLMIRRRQLAIKDLLPPITRKVVPFTLTSEEQAIHDALIPSRKLDTDYDPTSPTVVLISRLRQACDDPKLLPEEMYDEITASRKVRAAAGDATGAGTGTAAAAAPTEASSKAPTNTKTSGLDDIDDLTSALSKTAIDVKEHKSAWSSKITNIRKIILEDPSRKCVVFSSFVTMLTRIGKMLEEEGIGYKVYDGNLTASARQDVLQSFRKDDNTKVLLCSLNCAAVGINIVCASRVIMTEPWWNPMISDQAVNRVHRLGQTKPVDVYEMMATGAIEERIIEIQKKKRHLVANIMENQEKLSPQEVKYLIYGKR